jgi:hypothetical protein
MTVRTSRFADQLVQVRLRAPTFDLKRESKVLGRLSLSPSAASNISRQDQPFGHKVDTFVLLDRFQGAPNLIAIMSCSAYEIQDEF